MSFKISKISIQRKLVQKRDKQILYGIVRQKNCFGQTKYSLAPSKQVPIQDTFELIEKEKPTIEKYERLLKPQLAEASFMETPLERSLRASLQRTVFMKSTIVSPVSFLNNLER